MVASGTDVGMAGLWDLPETRRRTTQISANFFTSCALMTNRTIHCWGRNDFGQLGVELSGMQSSPPPVLLAQRAVKVAVGYQHTCALVELGGRIKCWGRNVEGQLGIESPTRTIVGLASGDMSSLSTAIGIEGAVDVAAGGRHTCAVLEGGAVKCWGRNQEGQLGHQESFAPTTTFGTHVGDNPGEMETLRPSLPASDVAVKVAAGYSHTCAVLANGAVKCWGQGSSGRLGYGNFNNIGTSPGMMSTLQTVPLGRRQSTDSVPKTAIDVALGDRHTCALLTGGSVQCWGDSNVGQLGYGSTSYVLSPGEPWASAGTVDLGGQLAVAIAAGQEHTCAALDDGSLKCWGMNDKGQLGQDDTVNRGGNLFYGVSDMSAVIGILVAAVAPSPPPPTEFVEAWAGFLTAPT